MKYKPEPQEAKPRRVLPWAVGLLLAGGAAYLMADWWSGVPADVQASYVGRQSCIQCHQREAERYTGSYHDKAMDLATEETVLGDFNAAALEHHGMTSRMFRRDGKFWINTEGPDGKNADFQIKYVFGVAPLQQYMVEFERPQNAAPNEIGRLQVLRVSWDTEKKRWFHLDPPDVKQRLAPNDDLHWTGISQRWNTMCADCHSTNLKRNFNRDSNLYRTTFSEIDVSCEACHGPGSVHVSLAEAWSPFWDRQRGYGLGKLKGESNIAEVESCAQCHSRRRVIHADYRPGEPLDDCFAVEPLQRLAYFADGSNRDEVYEYGSFTQSKMFHKNIRCSDCHDPHSTQLRFSGNKVCTSCHQHPASKYDTPQHHHHKDGSAGASCVECHMPATTYMDVDPRRDHGFRVPRPDLSVKYKTPNACTQCHLAQDKLPLGSQETAELKRKAYVDLVVAHDKTPNESLAHIDQWCADVTAKWYKPKERKEDKMVPAFTAARTGHPSSQQALADVALDETMPAIVRATAVGELARFARPESPALKASLAALQDANPLVRSAAASNLAALQPRELAENIGPLLPDASRLVRIETARMLAGPASEELSREERKAFHPALKEYFASLDELNDRPGSYLARGVTLERLGKEDEAEAAFRLAMRLDSNTVGPRTNLATLLATRASRTKADAEQAARSGDRQLVAELLEKLASDEVFVGHLLSEETERLQRDADLAPEIGGLQYQLAVALYLQDRPDEAEAALRKAIELEPNEAEYRIKLATELEQQERTAEALVQARAALDLWPKDKSYQELLARLEKAATPN
jgi:tetratricopeptide (TPR) repeat protein